MAEKNLTRFRASGLTMGYTVLYLSLIVMIPMAALFLRVFQFGAGSVAFGAKDFEDLPAFIETGERTTRQSFAVRLGKLPAPTQQQIVAGVQPMRRCRRSFSKP